MTIHKEGYKILTITFVGLLILNLAVRPFIMNFPTFQIAFGVLSFGMFLLVLQFFRSPNRIVTQNDEIIYCPADGKVVVIEETDETEYFKDKRIQVSVFMSPLNVHVNWAPMKGLVKLMKYHPGKFLVAWHPKSSTENERTTLVLENNKAAILVRQIAGAVARRIVFYPKEGETMAQGDQFGFIKFGSRVDVFLPLGTEILVNIDDKVTGNKTPLAKLK
jgi:phosphatidylserine decarboxylase